MKRMTYRNPDGDAVMNCARCLGYECFCDSEDCKRESTYRLAMIEDILGDEYDLDRLRELVQADKEGRCVVIPFKPPAWVYMCSKKHPNPGLAHYCAVVNVVSDMERGCVFGDTPEEAEAALKEMEK